MKLEKKFIISETQLRQFLQAKIMYDALSYGQVDKTWQWYNQALDLYLKNYSKTKKYKSYDELFNDLFYTFQPFVDS